MADKAKEVKVGPTIDEYVPKVTAFQALKAAMSPAEVLARPHDYEKWYNGMREEALNG